MLSVLDPIATQSPLRTIEDALDEISLSTDIVGTLGKTERWTAKDATNAHTRLQEAVKLIRSSVLTLRQQPESGLLSPAGTSAAPSPRRASELPAVMRRTSVSSAVSATSSGRSTTIPVPPPEEAPRASTARRSTTTTATTATKPPSRGFSVSRPMSTGVDLKVLQLKKSRRTSGGEGSKEGGVDVSRFMPAVLYTVVECAAQLLHAETAHLYMPIQDEMVCVVHVAKNPTYPPITIRHQAAGSLCGGVLASGVAVSQTSAATDDSGFSTQNLLLFPVKSLRSGEPIAVVQFANKHRGRSAFTALDENAAIHGANLIGTVLERHRGIDFKDVFFDPIAVLGSAPFVPSERYDVLQSSDQKLGDCLAADPEAASVIQRATSATAEFATPQLIHRSTVPVTLSRRQALQEKALGLSAVPTLLETDSYMANLQDCWRRSVNMNVQQTREDKSKTEQMKRMREELKLNKATVSALSEELRLQKLDSLDYHREYVSLKEELDGFLAHRRQVD